MPTSLRDRYEQFYAADRQQWRSWLRRNYKVSPGVWLIYYKKESGKPYVEYNDAVEEALCFGWIDSLMQPIDGRSYMQLFTPRKPKSAWSKSNKERVERLIQQKLMTPAGMQKIEAAKQDGSWTRHDDVENLVVPPELLSALKKTKGALANFQKFTPGVQKQFLFYLHNAKREETRAKRIAQIVEAAALGRKSLS